MLTPKQTWRKITKYKPRKQKVHVGINRDNTEGKLSYVSSSILQGEKTINIKSRVSWENKIIWSKGK